MINCIYSGGALGSDSVWGLLAEKAGVPKENILHIIYTGGRRPTGGSNPNRMEEQSSGTVITLNADQMDKAIKHLCKLDILISGVPASQYFNNYNGEVFQLETRQKLQTRNYWQVIKADAVYAVTPITDGKVTGGTATAINMAIALEKPVYILDPLKLHWFKFVQGDFVPVGKVKLQGNCACIGTRSLVQYKKKKFGNMWVDAPYIGETLEKKTREMMEAAIC